ncbi:hypothetical protein LTS18_012863, partial [Coniosporium uncinatum]
EVEEAIDLTAGGFDAADSFGRPSLSRTQSRASAGKTVIRFAHDDPAYPGNWSHRKKFIVVFISCLTVVNSTTTSGLAAGASDVLAAYFHVSNELELVLPTALYLVGYTFGPLVFGPLSEQYGRRNISMVAFTLFTIFQMACALAPNWAALNIFRLLIGIAGASPIAVVGGICADVYRTPEARGRAMAIFMASTTFGPLLGPIISGYMSVYSWRWSFWVGLIIAGVTWVPLAFIPESYEPVLLLRKAKRLRKETGDMNIVAPRELEDFTISDIVTKVIARPLKMIVTEPLVAFSCLYLSFVYALFYIFFQAYPIIYKGTYGFTNGEEGLAFLPIGIGACIACAIYLAYDAILRRAKAAGAPWSRSEEFRRLPLACFGGPFVVLSLFWAGWTARPDIHWIVPVLSGITFGRHGCRVYLTKSLRRCSAFCREADVPEPWDSMGV